MNTPLPLGLFCLLTAVTVSLSAEESLPPPWKHQDVGALQTPGTATAAAGVVTVAGTMDLWGTADGCHFVYQPLSGDGELVARVAAIDNPGKVDHAKAALCVRESLDPGARQVTLCVTPTDGTQFIYREKTDGKAARAYTDPKNPKTPPPGSLPKATFPIWLKLTRHGNEFTGYESPDGATWAVTGKLTLDLPKATLAGPAASSHKPDILTTATFDHVTVTSKEAKP